MKNTLVQYQGGGYDGCFWEWNYAYYDKAGTFHVISATGYQGITEDAAMREEIARNRSVYLYDLDNPDDLRELAVECNPQHILQIAQWLEENTDPQVCILAYCNGCETLFDALELSPEGSRYCGGVVYCHDETYCPQCYEDGTCGYCGEFVGVKYIHPDSGYCCDVDGNGNYLPCEGYCHTDHGDE